MVQGINVGKSYGAVDVFRGLSFSIARADKIALVGPNGCGKTTLLRLLAGLDASDAGGTIHVAQGITRGYLPQTAGAAEDSTLWQHAQTGLEALQAIQAQLVALEQAMQSTPRSDQLEAILRRYGELQHQFELRGGYTMDATIQRVLDGLGFTPQDWHKPLRALSGGQRVRARLAQLLLRSPDLLLLDEPTNHLDREGIEWLEAYLRTWDGTLVVVSHDRYFIDAVCDHVWELRPTATGAQLHTYRGNYTAFLAQRAARDAQATQHFKAQQAFIQKELDYIRRNIAGQHAAQAKGRLRRLERLEQLEQPTQQRTLHVHMRSAAPSSTIVLQTHGLVVGYTKPLFRVPDLVLRHGERIAVIGPNGSGKTTLLKTLLGEVPALGGELRFGSSIRLGYFAQAHETLQPGRTLIDELLVANPQLSISEARHWLGHFLFSGDDHFKRVGDLSGGERGRLALAKLALQGANMLLLDEPTNHLDIPSQEALTQALRRYDGTIILVSHDRYLIAALASQLWVLSRTADGKPLFTLFKGSYDEWRAQQSQRSAAPSEPVERLAASRAPAPPTPTLSPRRPPSKNAQRRREAQIAALEARIETLEQEMASLAERMSQAGNNFSQLQELGEAYRQAECDLAEAWAALEAMLNDSQ